MRFQCAALVLALMLPTALSAQDDDPELQSAPLIFNIAEGLTLRYAEVYSLASITSLPDGTEEARVTQTQQSIVRVDLKKVNLERGLAAASYTTESIRVTQTDLDGQETIIDSNDPKAIEKHPDAMLMLAMVGVPMDFVIERNGAILAANGKGLRDAVITKLGGSEASPESRSMVENALSDESIKQSLSLTLGTVPGRITTIGERWTTRFSLPAPGLGPIDILVESTLAHLEYQGNERMARIETRMIISDRPVAEPGAGPGSGRLLERSGSGVALFDTTRGVLASSSSDISLKVELKTRDQNQVERTTHSTIIIHRGLRLLPLDN